MPILKSGPGVIAALPPTVVIPRSELQPNQLELTYIDPDGNSWDLSDLDLTQGIICTDLSGVSGIPMALTTIPLVRGGAVPQLYTPQIRQILMGVWIQSTNNAAGQNDYLNMLDKFTLAFTSLRDDAPAPGTLIVQRPDGSSRQCTVFVTSGIDQPNDSTEMSGLLFTSYALTLQATDPYFYDLTDRPYKFGNASPGSVSELFDFEDGTDGWNISATGSTVVQSATWASTGTHSLQVTGDGSHSNPGATSDFIAVSPGQTITYAADLFASVSLTANIGFNTYDGTQTAVSSSFDTPFSLAATTKTTKSFNYTVPGDGSVQFVKIIFQISGTPANTVHLYGDNISLQNTIGILPLLPIALESASSFGDVTITNDGTAPSYPVWTITGPGTPVVTNNTTGKSWTLSPAVNNGQTIVVTTLPGQQSVVDGSTGDNLWANLVTDSSRDLWPFVHGNNDISLTVTDAGPATEIDMQLTQRWLRA